MGDPSLRILVVDQNVTRASILEEGLREAGYTIHDRLLRPALVGIAKAEAAPSGGNGPAPTINGSGEPAV